ncbi:hypothetical protein CAPTEDRAFT_174860 [Capitella teleta]|uniref:BTB domain-containing protein n=1 Tax=Capitella teleta TaxID=283909 RepID=R7T5P5_CAPTE|nr:hypothetical protein CAPTEDRAFT_174860 [Capitella teleta]|eukprot:ELT88493.1 hypothetical protein CAPTEDRAFT_174860 [Capitella teleta]
MRPSKDCPLKAFNFEASGHSASVLTGLNALREKDQLFDVTLVADGQSFGAHRVALAASSDYFRAMFTDAMLECKQTQIELNGVGALGLKHILDYAYTSKLTLTLGNIQDILRAASHLQLLPVVSACASYLHLQLDLDNCIDILTIAETYSLPELTRIVYCYIGQNFDRLVQMPEFENMSSSQILHFLHSEFPISCREVEVLQALLLWLNKDPISRMDGAKELLSCVRFQSIRRNEFQDLKKSCAYKEARGHSPHVANLLSGFMFGCRRSRVARYGTTEDTSCLINPRGFKKAIVNIGGFHCTRGLINDVTYFHPHSNQWKRLTSIPHVEQCDFGVAVIDNELYVVGGCFNQSLQEHVHPFGFKYNPRSDKWTTILPMLQERCRFYLAAVARKLYAIGGMTEQSEAMDPGSCECYNPETDTWHEISGLAVNRTQHAGAVQGHCVYISGGLDSGVVGDSVFDALLCYNVDEDAWMTKAPMLQSRADHAMLAHADKIYVAGGWHEDPSTGDRVITDTIDCYDPVADQWLCLTTVPTPRYHCSLTALGSTLYLIGGFGEGQFNRATKKIETFDVVQGKWEEHEDYPAELWEHCSSVLYVPTCRNDNNVTRGGDIGRRSRGHSSNPYAQ